MREGETVSIVSLFCYLTNDASYIYSQSITLSMAGG